MEDKPTAIDLFAGAGGITQGLKDAGYEVIYALDNDERCKVNFDANHDDACEEGLLLDTDDITEINPEELEIDPEDVDVVAGGPPCPTFSLVGRTKINSIEGRDNSEDDRHQLYEHFLRFVKYFEPDAFIMENVDGMESATNNEGEAVVEIIEDEMRDLGYWVNSQVVDAADYGVPQHRKRIFFIGSKESEESLPDLEEWESHRPPQDEEEKMVKPRTLGEDDQESLSHYEEGVDFPEFSKGPDKKLPYNTVADAIIDLPPVYPDRTDASSLKEDYSQVRGYSVPPLSQYQEWVRDIPEEADLHDHVVLGPDEKEELEHNLREEGMDDLPDHESRGHNIRDLTLYKMLGEGTGYRIGDLPDDFQPYRKDIFNDNYKKQNPKKPSSTVVAHISKDGHMFIHPNEARSLTPREAARLQSFRDSYIFDTPRTSTYRQIGNAVPPLLAKAVGVAVKKEILEDNS